MTVSENFKGFCDQLIQNDASAIYQRITRRLNSDFRNTDSETSNSWYIGSHGRRTATSKTSDVDMLYQLPNVLYSQYSNYQGNGQSALLQIVRDSLKNTYPSSSLGADGQVVIINFSDGTKFEVLPAFLNQAGTYTYPDSNRGGSWCITDPKPEIKAMKERDQLYNGNLRRLCRMMRTWKERHNVPIKGLLIDTLAYQFISTWEYRFKSYLYYDWMIRDFFQFLYNQDSIKTYWLAPGSSQRVYRTGAFEYRAGQAYKLSLEAIEYNESDMPYSERNKWREIFGTIYP
jgi:hypothetical protein